MKRRQLIKALALSLGTSLTGTTARAVLAGAGALDAIGSSTLSTPQLDLVAAVSELIIPTTDTPGAIAAGVPEFVHVLHSGWYRQDERERFDVGLVALDAKAESACSLSFVACSKQQQTAILTEAELQPESEVGRFFALMKELTVFGYYTSEIGSKEELVYNPVPMRYKGDYLFSEVGRQWTS